MVEVQFIEKVEEPTQFLPSKHHFMQNAFSIIKSFESSLCSLVLADIKTTIKCSKQINLL